MSNRNSDSSDLFSDERSLYELSLEDTIAQKVRTLAVKTGVPASAIPPTGGYNPYEASPTGSSRERTRKSTDLRKLSQWIRVQRQVNDLKKPGPDDPSG